MIAWINGQYFLTALAEWVACVVFATRPPKRLHRLAACGVSLGMLAVQIFALWITTGSNELVISASLGLQVLKGLLYVILMIIHIFLICRMRIRTAMILGMYAFLGSELSWGIEMFLQYLFIRSDVPLEQGVRWLLILAVFVVVFGIIFWIEKRFYDRVKQYEASVTDLIVTAVVTCVCYALSYIVLLFIQTGHQDVWDRTLAFIPRWGYILVGLFILYGRRIWKGYLQMRHELEMIHQVFDRQKGQYEQAKRNAEVINQQYHDLKNQIAIMKANISAAQQKEWLDGLEKKVEQIEPERLTGNPVLDTILWEKSQLCLYHDIKLSYVMDGDLFSGIAIDDLCVIFGGALDNAIEAVLKLEDPQQRLIHVKALRQQGFLVICVENITDAPPEYKDGEIQTTKEDKNHHGYGLKGIRYTAEKYGGSVHVDVENRWFRLNVLLRV